MQSRLRVIFVCARFYTEGSGVERAVCDLANTLGGLDVPITVYAAACNGQSAADHMLRPPSQCVAPPGRWLGGLSHTPELRRLLRQVVPQVDVVHIHTLWMLPNHYASAAAHRFRKPVLFTPHASLGPYALAQSRWKKRLVARWFQDRDLRRAACLQAFTLQELRGIRAYGLKNPVAVVPNGVDVRPFDHLPDRGEFDAAFPNAAGKRVCLYLSRLHPGKGLPHLIEAWRRLAGQYGDWHLVLVGPDDGQGATIRQMVHELQLEQAVTLTGPLFGSGKFQAFSAASMFVLPSFSEGFSMVLLEALAAGLPVLITPGCNFPEIEACRAGIQVLPNVDDTERGLRCFFSMSDAERAQMGARGRALVESGYTWEIIARRMMTLYEWITGGGLPPPFVETA